MAASTLSAPSARRVHPVRSFLVGDEPMPPALWGIIFFIFSEIMFFSGLIAAMLALHADTLHWEPTNGAHRLEGAELRPILFTILLVSTSIPMQIAAFSIRKGNRKTMIWSMAIVLVIGTAFIINQGFEWSHAGFGISDGTYAASFYTLTGFHGAHVIGGLVFISAQFIRGLLGHFDAKRNTAVEAATLYWHFVGFVWLLVIFPLVFFLS